MARMERNMNRLKLVLPTPDYKSKVMDYKREFVENGDRIYGAGGLKNAESFNNNLKEFPHLLWWGMNFAY